MTVSIRPVERADLGALFDLKVAARDAQFVAPNAVTLAEAPFERGAEVFTIWRDDRRVGLLALIDMTQQEDADPDDEPTSILVWRIMVAEQYQGRGYGTLALHWAMDRARALGRPRMSIEVAETNHAARRLYGRLGFEATGVTYGDEIQMARDL